MKLDEILSKLDQAFNRDDVKKAVLKPEWYIKNIESGINSTGFCYIANEVIYHLNGGFNKWQVVMISKKNWEHGSHWYLINDSTGKSLDITCDQYTFKRIRIPYELGKASGFLTKGLSKRAKLLAEMADLIPCRP